MDTAALKAAGLAVRPYNLMSLPLHERNRTRAQRTGQRPDSRKKGPGTERTAGGRARWIGGKAEEPRGREGARLFRADLQTRQDAAHGKRAPRAPRALRGRKWIGNTYVDDSGRDSPASLNSTGDM